MLTGIKIRLKPTPEQEVLFRKSAGVARWAYNFYLAENQRVYDEYKANGCTGKRTISGNDVRKYINNILKPTTHKWLSDVSSTVMKMSVIYADQALKNYITGRKSKPRYKTKHKSKISFYVNYESLKRVNGGFKGERLGIVKTAIPLPKISKKSHYVDPHISFDGKYWYLSFCIDAQYSKQELTDVSLGIDLGIKDLAICSNGKVYKNINKTSKVKKLKKKLKRMHRKRSRKRNDNIDHYIKKGKGQAPVFKRSLFECKNYQKQNQIIKLLERKLHNIRLNYIHQTTTEIVKTKPFCVVMEDLNVGGAMKNKHLSKAIQEQMWYEFRRQMTYKCERKGIKFILANRFYPSSKTCSCCGNIKSDLKLKDRVYKCEVCGLVIDRDFNASLNLAHYQSA